MSSTPSTPAVILTPLSQFEFHPRIEATPGPALVMFGSVGCGGCRHLRRILREVAAARPAWQLFEVDAQVDAALCSEFEVFHLPTLFLFDRGRFHCELHAEARPQAIVDAAELALLGPAEEAP